MGSNSRFTLANTVDILRMEQRDKEFINTIQETLSLFLRYYWKKDFNKYSKHIPELSKGIYYTFTTLRGFQTIGEEYAGIVRISRLDSRASLLISISWMMIFLYGSSAFEVVLKLLRQQLSTMDDLLPHIKQAIHNFINFLISHKDDFLKIHQALFFMGDPFYNVANRLTGLRYVLVRPWLEDNSSKKSFQLLGRVSFIYLMVYLFQEYNTQRSCSVNILEETPNISSKFCILCADICRNISATPCGHLFCWECIYDSLKYNPQCPVCRENINPSRIIYLKNF